MDVKWRVLGMNAAIVTMWGSNAGIGFEVPVDWFKTSVEDIVSIDSLLMRGWGVNAEGDDSGRPFPG